MIIRKMSSGSDGSAPRFASHQSCHPHSCQLKEVDVDDDDDDDDDNDDDDDDDDDDAMNRDEFNLLKVDKGIPEHKCRHVLAKIQVRKSLYL